MKDYRRKFIKKALFRLSRKREQFKIELLLFSDCEQINESATTENYANSAYFDFSQY
jgi:hypothetical protein